MKRLRKNAQHILEYLLFFAGMVGILLVVASPHGVIRQKTEDAINSALETIKDENYVRTYAWQLMECTACSATCTAGNSSASGEETCEVVCMRADGEVMTDETLCTESKPNPAQPCVISCPVDCQIAGESWECETCEVIDPSVCEPALCAEPNSCGKVGRQICERDMIPAQNGGRSCEELGLEYTTQQFCTPDEDTCPESICGNRYVDPDESCDMDVFQENLDECGDVGFDGGDLTCTDDCAFDTTECWTKNCEDWEDDKCGINAKDLNGDDLPCPDGEIRQNRVCYADYVDGRHILMDFDSADSDMTQCVPRNSCIFDCDDLWEYAQWCDPIQYNQGLIEDEHSVTYVTYGECLISSMEDVRCVAECPYDEHMVAGDSCACEGNWSLNGSVCECADPYVLDSSGDCVLSMCPNEGVCSGEAGITFRGVGFRCKGTAQAKIENNQMQLKVSSVFVGGWSGGEHLCDCSSAWKTVDFSDNEDTTIVRCRGSNFVVTAKIEEESCMMNMTASYDFYSTERASCSTSLE